MGLPDKIKTRIDWKEIEPKKPDKQKAGNPESYLSRITHTRIKVVCEQPLKSTVFTK